MRCRNRKWGIYQSLTKQVFPFWFFFSFAYENFENLLSQVRKSRNLLEFYFITTPVLLEPREKEEIVNLPLLPTMWFWVLLTHTTIKIQTSSLSRMQPHQAYMSMFEMKSLSIFLNCNKSGMNPRAMASSYQLQE